MRIRRTGIAKDTLLYHGTCGDDDFTELAPESWVSNNLDTAIWFTDYRGESNKRVLTFRVKKRITGLALIEGNEDFKNFVDWMEARTGNYDLRHEPRDLASATCRQGFNGWHIPFNYQSGGSDTLLCEPSRWLELVRVESLDRLWSF